MFCSVEKNLTHKSALYNWNIYFLNISSKYMPRCISHGSLEGSHLGEAVVYQTKQEKVPQSSYQTLLSSKVLKMIQLFKMAFT